MILWGTSLFYIFSQSHCLSYLFSWIVLCTELSHSSFCNFLCFCVVLRLAPQWSSFPSKMNQWPPKHKHWHGQQIGQKIKGQITTAAWRENIMTSSWAMNWSLCLQWWRQSIWELFPFWPWMLKQENSLQSTERFLYSLTRLWILLLKCWQEGPYAMQDILLATKAVAKVLASNIFTTKSLCFQTEYMGIQKRWWSLWTI